MKTKTIWTAQDIKNQHGALIIRESSPKDSTDLGFARTVTFKIGFLNSCTPKGRYGKIAIFTDGWFCQIADTAEEFAEWMNNDEYGYRPLTFNEAQLLLKDAENQIIINQ